MRLILLAICSFLFSVIVNAQTKACLDSIDVQEIDKAVGVHVPGETDLDPCNFKSVKYKLYEALIFVKNLKFKAQSSKISLNQDILPTDFWTYFENRASHINYVTNATDCSDTILAYVNASRNDGNVYICPSLVKDTYSLYERVSTLMHEVRHFDNHPHVHCTRGPKKHSSSRGCDEKIQDKGSYAVTVESLIKTANLAKGLSTATQSFIKISALEKIDSSFNLTPIPNGYTAIYLANKDKAYLYDGKKLIPAPLVPSNGKVLSRHSSLLFFPSDLSDAYTVDLLTSKFEKLEVSGKASVAYNQTPKEKRMQIGDILNGSYSVAGVRDNKIDLTIRAARNQIKKDFYKPLDFNATALFESYELGFKDEAAVYVRSDKDELYRAKPTANSIAVEKVENYAEGFLNLVMFEEKTRLGLTHNGELQYFDSGNWKLVEIAKDIKFDIMTRPVMWSEYVK